MSLDSSDRDQIRQIMNAIEKIAQKVVGPPFDPKIEVMLEMAHALLHEQLELEKEYFEWDGPAPRDDRFIDNTDIPSLDDLKDMWGEE